MLLFAVEVSACSEDQATPARVEYCHLLHGPEPKLPGVFAGPRTRR